MAPKSSRRITEKAKKRKSIQKLQRKRQNRLSVRKSVTKTLAARKSRKQKELEELKSLMESDSLDFRKAGISDSAIKSLRNGYLARARERGLISGKLSETRFLSWPTKYQGPTFNLKKEIFWPSEK